MTGSSYSRSLFGCCVEGDDDDTYRTSALLLYGMNVASHHIEVASK